MLEALGYASITTVITGNSDECFFIRHFLLNLKSDGLKEHFFTL